VGVDENKIVFLSKIITPNFSEAFLKKLTMSNLIIDTNSQYMPV
jgi:hypothetical protein